MKEWRAVGLHSTIQGAPRLFVRFTASGDGYAVELTDLVYIWREVLSRQDVNDRASRLETEIDPSQDKKQLQVLLGHIGNALHGKPNTRLELYRQRGSSPSSLLLNVSAKLPKPFEPLFWQVHLEQATQQEFYDLFLFPLLKSHFALSQEVASLLAVVAEKDATIEKLVDGLKAMNFDLGNIFPALGKGGKGLKGREVAGTVVRGLSTFSESKWRDEVAKDPPPKSGPSFIETLLEREDTKIKTEEDGMPSGTSWWDSMPLSTKNSNEKALLLSWATTRSMTSDKTQKDTQEDGAAGDQSTSADFETFEETQTESQPASPPREQTPEVPASEDVSSQATPMKKSKIGRIGGRNSQYSQSQSQQAEPSSPPAEELIPETQVEEHKTQIKEEPSSPKGMKTSRGKLGKIGGSKGGTKKEDKHIETVEEVADRRREELKRNLEADSIRGKPKRRRF